MVRNIVILGGSSHPQLVQTICNHLGIPPANVLLSKFSVGETRVEIKESVRGKDIYIIQSGCGKVNDNFMELLIAISACKTASAKKVTAVLPLFPYSRQSDVPYNKPGAPLAKTSGSWRPGFETNAFPTAPQTPHPDYKPSASLTNGHSDQLHKSLSKVEKGNKSQESSNGSGNNDYFSAPQGSQQQQPGTAVEDGARKRSNTLESNKSLVSDLHRAGSTLSFAPPRAGESADSREVFSPQPGYKTWVAEAGTLVADLLTCAGADHVITMDLHDAQYQGFFDIPVDNLYGRPLLKKYIQFNIPDYKNAVIVSPDAGGAKRATAIADSLGMSFALIHKERRPTRITDRQNATMMLVGDVERRTAILIDDLADTSNTITRAARLVKKEGATRVYALITHGILSGNAIDRINGSDLDRVVVTNSVPQDEHKARCPKLEVLEIGGVFAEAIRRVHHGESISVLFQYD